MMRYTYTSKGAGNSLGRCNACFLACSGPCICWNRAVLMGSNFVFGIVTISCASGRPDSSCSVPPVVCLLFSPVHRSWAWSLTELRGRNQDSTRVFLARSLVPKMRQALPCWTGLHPKEPRSNEGFANANDMSYSQSYG